MQVTQQQSGPLPAPQILKGYDDVVPGAADRILGEFQAQGAHRRRMEQFVVISDAVRAFLGLLIGGGLAVYMIYNGSQLLEAGKSIDGFGQIGTAIAVGGGAFIVRSVQQHRQRVAQNEAATQALAGNKS
jgi:uncharacterized membrane protein